MLEFNGSSDDEEKSGIDREVPLNSASKTVQVVVENSEAFDRDIFVSTLINVRVLAASGAEVWFG